MITLLLTLAYFFLLIVAVVVDFILLIPVLLAIWLIGSICEAVSDGRKKLVSRKKDEE